MALMLINGLWACAEAADGALQETVAAEGAALEAVLTLADLEALGAKTYLRDGRITFVDGACTAVPVQSMEDAARVVISRATASCFSLEGKGGILIPCQ